MFVRSVSRAAALLLVAAAPASADYSIKVVTAPPPKELAAAVGKLLGDQCVQFLDGKGELLAEVWMRKDVPAKATEAQVKNGLTLREIPETTLVGALRAAKALSDYRKQKVPPGVYTLRLGFQPQDGDHMGTAPFSEFVLVSPAADDDGVPTMKPRALFEMSVKATGAHAGVFVLFPGKDAGDEPKVADKGDGHWAVVLKMHVAVGDLKTTIGIALTLVGTSPAA
jgi:hypothetical protein